VVDFACVRRWSMGRVGFSLGVFVVCLLLPDCHPGIRAVFKQPECTLSGTEITANESGEFAVQALRPARYVLKVQATNFQMAEVHVDLTFTSARGF
jgi:hypothetical protein